MIQVNVLILDEPIYLDGQGPDPVVANALQLIGQLDHLELADFTVEQLVRRLPVTRRTLDRRFHAATGMTVLEKVNRQRLERAKTLLRETDLQVKAVVFYAGFSSQERMRVTFLKHEGLPPADYRAMKKQGCGHRLIGSPTSAVPRDDCEVRDYGTIVPRLAEAGMDAWDTALS